MYLTASLHQYGLMFVDALAIVLDQLLVFAATAAAKQHAMNQERLS